MSQCKSKTNQSTEVNAKIVRLNQSDSILESQVNEN